MRTPRPGSWLGLLLCGFAAAGCGPSGPPPPSVVLVTLDTTRVDRLSCYGYGRPTSPHLDHLAQEGVRYTRAWSTSSWTLPAHASLFTGLYPSEHGADFDDAGDASLGDVVKGDIFAKAIRVDGLGPSARTLAEALSERGYATGAFVGGPWLHRSFGLLQGFDRIDDDVAGTGGRPAEKVTSSALAWLATVGTDEPYFLFVNYFDPHLPYDPPPGFDDLPHAREPAPPAAAWDGILAGRVELTPAELEVLRDRYDGEIRYMDAALGRLLDAVRTRPDGGRTLVIVTADHGESFGEHGRYLHGHWLAEELVRIPFVVRYPGGRGAGTTSDAPVQLVDVFPIVAGEVGVATPDRVAGVPIGARTASFAELRRDPFAAARYGARYDRSLQAAMLWPFKLVRSSRNERALLALDAGSLAETPAEDPAAGERLAVLLDQRPTHARPTDGKPKAVAPDTYEALKSLGYVE